MAENVQVFCRVRPPNARELVGGSARRCVSTDPIESTSLVLASQVQAKKEPPRNFFFDRVFGERSTQEQVFEVVGRPITTACLEGYNGTIFAYGQTGSGKTFTMLGEEDQAGRANLNKGLVPRVLEYLFQQRDVHEGSTEFEASSTVEYKYICSFLEIYNERVFDLLDSTTTENGLNLRENHIKGVFVEGLKEIVVESAQQATDLMVLGTQNRHVGHTSMNRESSRSHSVFILQIHSKETTTSGLIKKRQARFNLVDLAGSERQKSTEAAGERLKEAGNINKSLSALGNVIMALSEQAVGKTRHVHYRDSKLTYLLKDSLGGNSKTFMIAAISPAEDNMGETHSTLKFAQRAKMIKNNAFINEDTTGNIQLLQEEIKRLRLQLQQQGGNNVSHEPSFPIPSNYNPFSELNDNPLPVDCDPVVDTRFRDLENTLSNIVDEHTTQKREMEVLQMRESQYQELCAQLKRKMLHLRFLLKLRADKETNVEHIERIQQELEYNPSVDSLEWRIKYDDMERMYYDLQEEYNQLRDGPRQTDEVARIQQMHFDIAKQLSLVIQDKHILQDRLGNTNGVVEAMPDNNAIVAMEAKISQAQALQNLAEEELAKNLLETQRLRERVQNQDVKVNSQQILIEDQDQQIRVLQEVLMNERAVREESVATIKRERDNVIDTLKQRCLEWEYRVAMATQESNSADTKVRAMETQLNEVRVAAQMKEADLEQKLTLAQDNTKDLMDQIDTISKEKQELQRLLDESVAREAIGVEQLAGVQTQLENSALEIKNLTLALRQSEANLVTAQSAAETKAIDFESRIESLQDEVASLLAKIEGLEADRAAISEALDAKDDTLQATIGDVERVTFELEQVTQTLESKQAEFDLTLTDKTQQINALELTVSGLEATLKTTKEEADSAIQSLQNQVHQLELTKAQLEHTVEELEAASNRHVEASEVQVNELREALEAKEDTLQATIDDLEQISHTLDVVKAELAEKEVQWAESLKKLEHDHLAEVANLTKLNETAHANHEEATLAIEHHIGERDALLVQKATLEATITDLKVQKDAEASSYETKLAEVREVLDTTDDKLQASLGEIERLQYELNAAANDYSIREDELKISLAEEQDQKNAAIAKFESVVSDLETRLSELEIAKKQVESEFASSTESFKLEVACLQSAKAELQEKHEKSVTAFEANVAELRSELDEKEDALQSSIGNSERLAFEMEEAAKQHTSEINSANAAYSKLEKEFATTQKQLEEKISALNQDIVAKQAAIDDVEQALKDAKGEIIVVNNLLQLSNDEKITLKAQAASRENSLNAQVEDLTAKVNDAQQYNDVLRNTLQLDKQEFTAKIEQLEASIVAAEAKVPPLLERIAFLEKEVEDCSKGGLARIKDQLRSEMDKLTADRKRWKYKNEQLMLKAIENEYAMNQAKRDNERLVEDLAEMQSRLDALNEEKDKLVGHHNAKQKIQHHIKVKEENNQLVAQVRQLTDDNFKLKKQVEKLEVFVNQDADAAAALGSPLKRQKSLTMMPMESPMRGKRTRF